MGTWTLTREPGGRPAASKEATDGVPDDPGGGPGTRPHRTSAPPYEPRRMRKALTREPGHSPATNCVTNQALGEKNWNLGAHARAGRAPGDELHHESGVCDKRKKNWNLDAHARAGRGARRQVRKPPMGAPDDPGGGPGTRPHRTPTPPHEPRRARKALTREPGIPRRRTVSRIRQSARRVGTRTLTREPGGRPAARRRHRWCTGRSRGAGHTRPTGHPRLLAGLSDLAERGRYSEAGRRGQRRTYADGAAAPEECNHNSGKKESGRRKKRLTPGPHMECGANRGDGR